MDLINQLQAYMHFAVGRRRQRVCQPAFKLYFHSSQTKPQENYAVPITVPQKPLSTYTQALEALFAERGCALSFRLLDSFAPSFVAELHQAGYTLLWSSDLLVCTPQTLVPFAQPKGFSVEALTAASPNDALQTHMLCQHRGFVPEGPPPTNIDRDIQIFKEELGAGHAFTAQLNGQPAGAGMYPGIDNQVTELVGICTIKTQRRQGVATALTQLMARAAFAQGADGVFLTTDNPAADRLYRRLGFSPQGKLLLFSASALPPTG